jgi:transcriptional regulator with XRE-family HTH domain
VGADDAGLVAGLTQTLSFINKDFHKTCIFDIIFVMPKAPKTFSRMPPQALAALEKLGAELAVARLRRKESLATRAQRMGVSVPTLLRMESGEPGVGIGIYAYALWAIGRVEALAELAAPEHDQGALDRDVAAARATGLARAKASSLSRGGRMRGGGDA